MTNQRGRSLAVERVSHRFGATLALDDVSLSISPGELIALLGPSGCGKTTLLRIIAGFMKPTDGVVRLDGTAINDVPANRRNVGIVFQNYALFPHLSVFENVAYGLKARGAPRASVRERAFEMLRLVHMTALAERLPGELSGGQQQRTALARALAIEPELVLLDEPFSALDKSLRLDMQIEVRSLLRSYGLTSIMVTHDQDEALSMADRIVVLNAGRVEQVDSPERLYDEPRTLFVNCFVGQTNLFDAIVRSSDGDLITLELAAGATITAPKPARFLPRGAAAVVSIRPENLTLRSVADPTSFPATVRLSMPMGPQEVVEAGLRTGRSVKLTRPRTGSREVLRGGEEVFLSVADTTRLRVFRAEDAPSPVLS